MSYSLRPHGLQHTRLFCPPLSPRVCSNSRPLSWWCNLAISSSAVPFSFCLQSFLASGSFPMSLPPHLSVTIILETRYHSHSLSQLRTWAFKCLAKTTQLASVTAVVWSQHSNPASLVLQNVLTHPVVFSTPYALKIDINFKINLIIRIQSTWIKVITSIITCTDKNFQLQ